VLGVRLTVSERDALARAASRLRAGSYTVLGVRLTVSERDALARAASRLRAGSYSRRQFLGTAGALVGGALLGGCGAKEAGKEPPTDAEVLGGLLRRELAAGAAVVGVTGSELIARQDVLHARRLASLAGIDQPEAAAAVDLTTALARKQDAVFAYVEALPRLADPEARVLVMQVAASEAEHLAALRLAAGVDPVPDPFVGFTEGMAP
jgi:TAT (twin-arginine translocation) pathway signal sequence